MTAGGDTQIAVARTTDGVHTEMLRRASYACRPLVLIAIPASITLALLADRAPVWSRLGYVVMVTTFALLSVAALTALLRAINRDQGGVEPATRVATLSLVLPAPNLEG